MRFWTLAMLLFFSLSACSESEQKSGVSALDPEFINLVDFVAAEQERMAGIPITKTVTVNGIEETKELSDVDWKLELAPFAQSNIDKAALWDGYLVDTLLPSNSRLIQVYTSIDSSSFTKVLEVSWSDSAFPLDSVYSISIDNGFNSYIANTSQQLMWWNGGYEIVSTQDALLSEKRELKIQAEWSTDVVDPYSEGMSSGPH